MGTEGEILVFLISTAAVLIFVFRCVSNSYIKKHQEELYNANLPLSQTSKEMGNRLLEQYSTYLQYIRELGLCQNYRCSSSVVSNAANNVVKYLIKYSSIENGEYSLDRIDFCVEWKQNLNKLYSDLTTIRENAKSSLPIFIRIFASMKKAPYTICSVDYSIAKIKPLHFCFIYISPAGKNRRTFTVEITERVLQAIESEISAKISKSGHSRSQRSAMTNDLREAIKKRDNYTCCICGNSVYNEPNLLLEVDHIIPIAKGGKTEASNLQTLCWRCNRQKRDN